MRNIDSGHSDLADWADSTVEVKLGVRETLMGGFKLGELFLVAL